MGLLNPRSTERKRDARLGLGMSFSQSSRRVYSGSLKSLPPCCPFRLRLRRRLAHIPCVWVRQGYEPLLPFRGFVRVGRRALHRDGRRRGRRRQDPEGNLCRSGTPPRPSPPLKTVHATWGRHRAPPRGRGAAEGKEGFAASKIQATYWMWRCRRHFVWQRFTTRHRGR